MADVNITNLLLLNVPLENDYKHTLFFNNKTEQYNYFKTKLVKEYTEFSYQRKDHTVRLNEHIDTLYGTLKANYVMYKNSAYGDKWFYAFITNMEYVNDGVTKLFLQTDVMQTWLEEISVKDSFIEREHTDNDTRGLHTLPEQLETGEYVINDEIKNKSLTYRGYIVGATVDIANPTVTGSGSDVTATFENVGGGKYNGVFSGIRYFYIATDETLNGVIKSLAKASKSDAIVSIFMCPSQYISTTAPASGTTGILYVDFDELTLQTLTGLAAKTISWNGILGVEQEDILKPTTVNGYTPRNKKLLTYPYSYLLMSNNSGGSAIYQYELFKDQTNANKCDFNVHFALTPGCSIRITPKYYNGSDGDSNEWGLNLGKFPVCAWTTDVYMNWLTQNAINIPMQYISGAAQIGAGVAMAVGSGGMGAVLGGGSIVGGVQTIAGVMSEQYQHSLVPPQAEGNINSGDVTFGKGDLTFTAYKMSIKKEFAQAIDSFFDMYGYKTHLVKKPNKNHRARYWYTKTVDVNIDGPIPNDDMQQIKDCYNRGITFWRSTATMNDYTTANNIISN